MEFLPRFQVFFILFFVQIRGGHKYLLDFGVADSRSRLFASRLVARNAAESQGHDASPSQFMIAERT